MGSNGKVYSFDEVAKHNHRKDCWIVISGKVYNVTSFLEEHPGGDEVLLLAVEKDATDDFEDVGHSESAKQLLENYYVGKVDTATLPEKPNYRPTPTTESASESKKSYGVLIKVLQLLLPLLIAGLAYSLPYFRTKV